MTEIKTLISRRGALKGQITQFFAYVSTSTVHNSAQLAVRLEKAEQTYSRFEEVQLEIEIAKRETQEAQGLALTMEQMQDLEEEFLMERKTVDDVYFEAVTKARQIITETRPRDNDQLMQTNRAAPPKINVKLPMLELPKFDGNYNQWMHFRDTFTSVIDCRDDLTNVQKLQYLKSTLTGEALTAIEALETTQANYTIAWDLVKNRYENKKLIIHTHLKELFELQQLLKASNHSELRRLIDVVRTHLRALESLGQPIKQWDTILIYLVTSKLDYATRKDWELYTARDEDQELPTMDKLFEFLTQRSHTLELVEAKQDAGKIGGQKKFERKVSLATTNTASCEYCQEGHPIFRCEKFAKLSIEERRQEVRSRQLCYNCLRKGHYVQACGSSTCKKCSEKHNTLLHSNPEKGTAPSKTKKESTSQAEAVLTSNCSVEEEVEDSTADQRNTSSSERYNEEASMVTHAARQRSSQVILATAQIQIHDTHGKVTTCRALLDPGSQSNLITRDLATRLGLPRTKVNIPVSGVCLTRSKVTETVQVRIKSMHNSYSTTLKCLILPNITEKLPQVKIDPEVLRIPSRLNLADPDYYTPGTIDLLIGSGCFWSLLCVGQHKLEKNQPLLQKTVLGWIIGGDLIDKRVPEAQTRCQLVSTRVIDKQLEKFWEIEELQPKKFLTHKEQLCEEYFRKTVSRQTDGRYVVRLPKDAAVTLGNSKEFAQRRLYAIERRLSRESQLKQEYNDFLKQYLALGHMSELSDENCEEVEEHFFLPHHPVIRATSLTTKVRVVFDGSAKSASGSSLNDKLLTGPNLQEELIDIVLRFRCHQYVITADVAMMFRQIIVNKEDRKLQQILWRNDPREPVKTYTLNTVTYGTSCAPYLAIRCLKQLAEEDEAKGYPAAANALRLDFYMDDVLTGSSTVERTIDLQEQLQALLAKGQFPLRKWRTNEPKILERLSDDSKASELLVLDKHEPLKTLGLLWNSSLDTLQYSVKITESEKPTKRHILSQIARIYDPLGLIGPVMITAKIVMQELWKLKLTWDESVPQTTHTNWLNYYRALPKINELVIERNANPGNHTEQVDLFGFSDASERAYGACLYTSYTTSNGETKSFLLCSKTRVAPLKVISLPKLELCAALLLARLSDSAKRALRGKVRDIHLWSDSTIVLCWIKTSPHELKTFFANRVSEIQSLTADAEWHHVPTDENPADMLSRGISVENILKNRLWWHGPPWMALKEEWPRQPQYQVQEDLGRKAEVILTAIPTQYEILERYSRLDKLQRIFGYVARFIRKCRGDPDDDDNRRVTELNVAMRLILRAVQRVSFAQDLRDLQADKPVSSQSPLRQLNPFIDECGLIRVGGRLKNSNLSTDRKHPIVLPSKHHVTTLILRQEHLKLRHCGPQQLLSSVRMKYWPLAGRREARKVTQGCVPCFRSRPYTLDPMMANLPATRVTEAIRPFEVCGVDYAGPFKLRESRRRGRVPTSKAYIAVIVCFKTKAVHLELVSNLTTDAFLAALKRFAARRGTSSHIYSDNGTNFVGAARELAEIYEFLKGNETEISTTLAVQHITWHFIPPRAPHFGGLWEAAVKSVKKHLTITVKDQLFTFEEYYTLITEIEAILNSRPLTQLSSDPNDYTALTPSHFLIGGSLLHPAERHYVDVPDNKLNRWQHLQKLKEHYWKRWNREYLHQLQTRTKWSRGTPNLEVGTLVLLIEDNLPPTQWKLGRVTEVHPSDDNVVRVATIKTASAVYKRAVTKLCALPYDNTDNL